MRLVFSWVITNLSYPFKVGNYKLISECVNILFLQDSPSKKKKVGKKAIFVITDNVPKITYRAEWTENTQIKSTPKCSAEFWEEIWGFEEGISKK